MKLYAPQLKFLRAEDKLFLMVNLDVELSAPTWPVQYFQGEKNFFFLKQKMKKLEKKKFLYQL